MARSSFSLFSDWQDYCAGRLPAAPSSVEIAAAWADYLRDAADLEAEEAFGFQTAGEIRRMASALRSLAYAAGLGACESYKAAGSALEAEAAALMDVQTAASPAEAVISLARWAELAGICFTPISNELRGAARDLASDLEIAAGNMDGNQESEA